MHWYSKPFRMMDTTFIQSAAALVLFLYILFLHITRSKDRPGEREREREGCQYVVSHVGTKARSF